jgi:hypothetical protein
MMIMDQFCKSLKEIVNFLSIPTVLLHGFLSDEIPRYRPDWSPFFIGPAIYCYVWCLMSSYCYFDGRYAT